MRRPHRSIEVFDISLMAVVTKAMGAFLVLMLLLMPYYSSGPIGQKAAEDLAKKVQEVDKNIKAAMQELATASAEDLRKKLEEALKQLEEARKLLVEVQRANDALNAQVARLEEDKKQLAAQAAQLQQRVDALAARVNPLEKENAELRKRLANDLAPEINGLLVNSDCHDVGFMLGLWSDDSYRKLPNNGQSKYVLNLPSLGTATTYSDADVIKANPINGAVPPGRGARFNSATFNFHGAPNGTYAVVATARSTSPPGKDGLYQLKKPAADCTLYVTTQVLTKERGVIGGNFYHEIRFAKNNYAIVLWDILLSDKGADSVDASPQIAAWLNDQIEHADKEQ